MTLSRKNTAMWTALSLLFLPLVLMVGPAPALAGGDRDGDDDRGKHRRKNKDVVLYELTENAEFTDFVTLPDSTVVPTTRKATSALQGKANAGTPLCPDALLDVVLPSLPFHIKATKRCVVTAIGESAISLITFGGTINGDFAVVINTEETNPTDAAELVVLAGTFDGNVQVTDPDGVIITLTSGTFKPTALIGGLGQPGLCQGLGICDATFTGKFRLPFKFRHSAVYKKDDGRSVKVEDDERALGDPTVRLEINFD